ncbi:MAG: methylenetetrahydrofolate reductase [NAD(P)H] [Bacteroidetes bacterium GWF2_41_61]|nr:MAG: methylenetetrahydrofolate reductase [NAD(P)H] [Bacteroidetes bacterium GWE2_40_15]OFY31125.1 MAG: methylenetetrahydrofolate reductase [NAD(P)H] [Bacteroidetes bacterium GWF2_41_61]OFY88429.1 MAG: methylenetetrahydrofolate reductase [NAD(P)H] [Bacteroidetes bacterium RIFOXYA12_FULL_40_10]HBG24306.1 methylenetetrahydrofolate reductase [NAD(P)H] [Rikenellaceae bacterium]HBZ26674.1 methylenetetrahydrofolate reductase [NAD(P)H] [Rikenellaceae bacterium]
MTVIEKINNAKSPLFTFELLPPLKGHSIDKIYASIEGLLEFEPAYINFTSHRNETLYRERADGTLERRVARIRPGTIALAAAVKYKYNITVVPHLLCGGFTKEETENALIEMNFLGINDVLALRGDPVKGTRMFIPERDGHRNTNELIEQVVNLNKGRYLDSSMESASPTSFCIGVAGYPEKHFEAPNLEVDMAYLKQKVDAGAHYIVTQMFFDNEKFYRFRDLCHKIGITVPIIPGIKPISALNDIKLLPQTFNIDVPQDLFKAVVKCKDDKEAREAGIEWATMQSKDLIKNGVPGIHFYTLGRSDNVARIVKSSY